MWYNILMDQATSSEILDATSSINNSSSTTSTTTDTFIPIDPGVDTLISGNYSTSTETSPDVYYSNALLIIIIGLLLFDLLRRMFAKEVK